MFKKEKEDKYDESEDEEKEREQEVFAMFDKNKDGRISKDELGLVLRGLNLDPTQKELDAITKQLDKDGNGILELNDIKLYLSHRKKSTLQDRKQDILAAFRIFDKNGDKFIDCKELISVLTSLGEPLTQEEAAAMIRVADVNLDGRIDYEEFANFILAANHN